MSRQDLKPREKVQQLGASIVHVVNLSDVPFKAECAGQLYVLQPNTKRPVLRKFAEHWLGDPLAGDASERGNTWAQEMARLQNLYGIPDSSASRVKDKPDYFSLIREGKIYCPEFGPNHIKKLQDMTPQVRVALQGIPLERDEIEAAQGSIPLSKSEVEALSRETSSAVKEAAVEATTNYIGYGSEDEFLAKAIADEFS